jgi:hypothetical protein
VATDALGLSTVSAPVPISINGPPVVSITSPTNGGFVPQGNVIINASAVDTNGGVAQVDFYVGGNLIRSAFAPPYSATLSNAALGPYSTFAVARDTIGLSATSAVSTFNVVAQGTNFSDMFAGRGLVTGYTNFKTGSTVSATKEPGEPNHWSFNAGGKSLWIDWLAPGAGVVTIDLLGSSFDTLLAVYTNTPGLAPAVSNLTKVAENDDNGSFLQSRVQFTNTVPGTVFHIAVDGYNAASGNVQLRIGLPNSPPVITLQPQSQTNNPGANVTFTVAANSPSPLSYQWRFNGGDMGGATAASLTVTNIQASNGGDYTVVCANSSGSVTSLVATLTVEGGPAPPLFVFARATNNLFSMTFSGGLSNRSYIIESTDTLTNWNYYSTITTTGAVTLVETNSLSLGRIRAFRMRLGP